MQTVLEKKLVKTADESNSKGAKLMENVKLLLASNEQEERRTLEAMGLGNNLLYAERINEDVIIRTESEEFFGKRVVKIEDIKALCLDYRLYMKRANLYIGQIPPELGAELTRFCKEKNVVMPASSDYSDFYIIAPPKMFKGYKKPSAVFAEAVEETNKKIEEEVKKAREAMEKRMAAFLATQNDPILVYRIPDREGYYAIIKSWGNDLTWVRKIYGFFTRKRVVKSISTITNLMVLGILYLLMHWQTNFFIHKSGEVQTEDGWLFLSGLITMLALVFATVWMWGPLSELRKSVIRQVTEQNEPESVK